MADNHNPDWMRALARLQSEFDEDTLLHVGHGATLTPAFLPWQAAYLERFERAIRSADWRDPSGAEAEVIASDAGIPAQRNSPLLPAAVDRAQRATPWRPVMLHKGQDEGRSLAPDGMPALHT